MLADVRRVLFLFVHKSARYEMEWRVTTTAVIEWRVYDIKMLGEVDPDAMMSVEMRRHDDEK